MRLDKGNILKPTPAFYLIPIKSKNVPTLTSWRHYLTSYDLSGGHISKVAPRSSTVAYVNMVLNDLNRSDKYLRYLSFPIYL